MTDEVTLYQATWNYQFKTLKHFVFGEPVFIRPAELGGIQQVSFINPEHFDHRSADASISFAPGSPICHPLEKALLSPSLSILLHGSEAALPFQGFSIFLYGLSTMKNRPIAPRSIVNSVGHFDHRLADPSISFAPGSPICHPLGKALLSPGLLRCLVKSVDLIICFCSKISEGQENL